MLSSFGVQKYIAHSMTKDHVILAGDAAHIINPIGGQGMNLGWLGAWDLSKTLLKIFNGKNKSSAFSAFESRRKKAAQNAIKRAEINMRLGRRSKHPDLRNVLVRIMLTKPFSHLMARIFTMRGIERWVM
jgi:2-polyprenyl-6-methoxyphenol hydroxylase-like FAD-dependent oxidoreductase